MIERGDLKVSIIIIIARKDKMIISQMKIPTTLYLFIFQRASTKIGRGKTEAG